MIGGEFPIAVTDVLNAEGRHSATPDVYTYSSGRAALYQILKYLKQDKGITRVLLPDYLCSSVLVPVKALGLEFAFYTIDDSLELEQENLSIIYKNNTVVLLINYYGLKNLDKQIKTIRAIDENAITDD